MTAAARIPVLFVAGALGHWLWVTHLSFKGLAPQWLLVLTAALAARRGPIPAMLMGFGWGLFLDLLGARLFGANALALTLVAFGTGTARRQIDVNGLAPQCVVVFMMTWAYFLLLGALGSVFLKEFFWVGWLPFLIDPFYNALAAAVLYAVWDPWRDR